MRRTTFLKAPFIKALVASTLVVGLTAPSFTADLYTNDNNIFEKSISAFKGLGKGLGKSIHKLRDGEARACGDEKILKRLKKQFAHQAEEELQREKLAINSLTGVHQHRHYAATEERQIARRYCGATAHLNNGHRHDVWYIIEDGMGLASIDDGVTYCVSGYDQWYVHNGACRIPR